VRGIDSLPAAAVRQNRQSLPHRETAPGNESAALAHRLSGRRLSVFLVPKILGIEKL
jgi:hypothetical protein